MRCAEMPDAALAAMSPPSLLKAEVGLNFVYILHHSGSILAALIPGRACRQLYNF